jgi:hypothetical protein
MEMRDWGLEKGNERWRCEWLPKIEIMKWIERYIKEIEMEELEKGDGVMEMGESKRVE